MVQRLVLRDGTNVVERWNNEWRKLELPLMTTTNGNERVTTGGKSKERSGPREFTVAPALKTKSNAALAAETSSWWEMGGREMIYPPSRGPTIEPPSLVRSGQRISACLPVVPPLPLPGPCC